MLTGKENKLLQSIEEVMLGSNIEVVTLEIVGAKKAPIIRVYVDTPDGVGFDVLTMAQSKIGDLLDRIDPFPGAYTLEVSSPGIDRPLRTEEHFQRFAGETAQIRTVSPMEGRSNFKGELLGANDGVVAIECDGTKFEIPMKNIRRANVIGTVEF